MCFWKAVSVALFNVRRAFRYSPGEKSGAATAIPFIKGGRYYYLRLY
ncbi:hypothetical protein SAMN04488511_108154 [Pedobacter suwonensis]|jgi:hypothetical protein|uniref:Uncharacterized protein n=1 Tax=Pedobacter suwonensis TaxID=332999 RepID=A0A1I0TCU3_9SPHI|nr:hypothetical protein SAMN04488511_108154 [Pedobacter suwonensis]